jgi:hypothetical protein
MKNERHLVSDNLDFDAGALDYKIRNNALIQIVINARVYRGAVMFVKGERNE